MVFVIVMHEVKDYKKWRPVFDSDETDRKKGGELGESRVFQDAKNSKNIVMLFEWESKEKLDKFMASDTLKQKMKQAGVTSQPMAYVLEEK